MWKEENTATTSKLALCMITKKICEKDDMFSGKEINYANDRDHGL